MNWFWFFFLFGNNVYLKSEIDWNYIYANVMQQPDQLSCGLFVIAYDVDVAFNFNVQKLKYVVFKMRQHLKNYLNAK